MEKTQVTPLHKKTRVYRRRIDRPKLSSLLNSEDFCLNLICGQRIPIAILSQLRSERPGEKRYYCPDCEKRIGRGKPPYR